MDNAHKPIRSFVIRQGHLTRGQQTALENHWNTYCLDFNETFNMSELFPQTAPLIVEIGFGNGECLATMAKQNPQYNYLGIEVHKPGVGHLLHLLDKEQLTNVKVFCHDAVEVFNQHILNNSLMGVHLFFPDPWHKKRHHKRRIVNSTFMDLVVNKLQVGGYFHAATDWENYAESMLDVLTTNEHLKNKSSTNQFCERPDYRPLTKFEQRGLKLGHGVWDLIFEKK